VTAAWPGRAAASPLLAPIRERLAAGTVVAVSGLAGAARLLLPLLVSARPLLLVVPKERDVEEAAQDLGLLASEAGLPGQVAAFPAPGPSPFRGIPRHPESALLRAAALHAAARGKLRALVASPAGLLRPSLSPERLVTRVVELRRGEEMTPEILLEALDEGGYRREDPVSAAGQMARRGGILDVFPPDRTRPVRLEFFADTLESLRAFDPQTQRTTETLEAVEILPLSDLFPTRSLIEPLRACAARVYGESGMGAAFLERMDRGLVPEEVVELLPLVEGATVPPWEHIAEPLLVVLEPEDTAREAEALLEGWREDQGRRGTGPAVAPSDLLVSPALLARRFEGGPALHLREIGGDTHVASRPVRRYAGDLRRLTADLADAPGHTVLFLGSPGRAERTRDVLRETGLAPGEDGRVDVRVGALSRGFELPDAELTLLADGDVFPEEVHLHARGRRLGLRGFLSDFRDLKVGDLVVHQDHGIGRFEGLETLEVGGQHRELMVLAYQGGDKLKVPVESFDRVQKYATAEGARPVIDRLGSGSWEKVKKRVRKAMRDMAAELLRLYAARKARPGHAFGSESPWLREFEESFEYETTPDQAAAIDEVARDMESPSPMDRIICGDVGYGKTEVAMRAAMRAVLDGKQVAVLAPTTILAFQHWKTFRKRFAPFPVTIEMASRFRPAREIKEVLASAAAGAVDILIGTHRILSKDVAFRDLGLLVVDEEQRFGVAAKERLKHLRTSVDCLTLSATPIPRTLQMGLAGIRDMSVIETPPKDRMAIQTAIVKFSTDVIATALRQELGREGQAYLVHNRVESIYSLAHLVQRLVPEARVAVAHGQMPEAELEKTMLAFVEGRVDVLVATTIIENGLDIPRANTLIVNRADRYGLSQLYQLRGRVGRSDRQAYAHLLVPPDTVLSEVARKRLAAIREFSDLGAGFRIAALDLELRGAGNLLGGQQSGHIQAVGLDLYVKLLEQTILELKGEAPPESARATVNLRIDLRIPADYVPAVEQRMSLYKRASQARTPAEVQALGEEIRDRYGPPPQEATTLLEFAAQRLRAEALGVTQVDRVGAALQLRLAPQAPYPPRALVSLVSSIPGAALTPDGVLRVPVPAQLGALPALAGALDLLTPLVPAAVHTL
jgi:transcription-repair coupling factor (superfamily II helicase)